ncbi:hypothetical protein RPQ02_40185 [Streptomyces sp. AM2-3-1]|uniref:hypothetical protein n=1 Tax=Streptomyces sp. AM2-3-1 TaxID=3075824 RepID=UPI0028C4CACC|nr:hypothetical protein [Streptomyces sp. AM2-3-1]WNO62413.1 hypothetical protein RPQ02_00595 [Streptomyces sp. AM2-3-1]WNO69533.1 hypothetical protein RPQ02_40185 [Streptomyces sp. AM2-3-1]
MTAAELEVLVWQSRTLVPGRKARHTGIDLDLLREVYALRGEIPYELAIPTPRKNVSAEGWEEELAGAEAAWNERARTLLAFAARHSLIGRGAKSRDCLGWLAGDHNRGHYGDSDCPLRTSRQDMDREMRAWFAAGADAAKRPRSRPHGEDHRHLDHPLGWLVREGGRLRPAVVTACNWKLSGTRDAPDLGYHTEELEVLRTRAAEVSPLLAVSVIPGWYAPAAQIAVWRTDRLTM